MDTLIEEVKTLRKKCKGIGLAIKEKLRTDDTDPRHGCFAMLFNRSTLTLELLSYYSNCWKRQMVGSKVIDERLKIDPQMK